MKEAEPASEASCVLNKSHTKFQLNTIINKITYKNKLKVYSTRMCGDSSPKVVFISSTRVLGVQSQKMLLCGDASLEELFISSTRVLGVQSQKMVLCGDSSLEALFISSTRVLGVQSQKMVLCGDSSLEELFISSTRVLGVQSQKMVLFRNTSCQTTCHIQENCRFRQTTRHNISEDVTFQEEIPARHPTTHREIHALQFSNIAFIKSDNSERMWYEENWRLICKCAS